MKVPVADGAQVRLFGRWWRNVREVPRHLCLPSTAGLRRMFERYGLIQVRQRAASLFENACMFGTTLYPWAIPYRNAQAAIPPTAKLLNTGIGAALTYLSLPEALLEAAVGRASTVIVAAQRIA